jgi:Lon protease-like protein
MFMEIPSEVAVMTLPRETLFPQALLPLYIFEPRYRRMLTEALQSHRMFVIAMQRKGHARECPSVIAGLGLIRVCVDNPDGSSHLILQGLSRVELTRTVRAKPFRVSKVRMLQAPPRDSVAIDALVAKVRDLVSERIRLGLRVRADVPQESIKEITTYLDRMSDPDEVADLVSHTLLPGPAERQTILETIEIEPRLKHLIHFLMAEIKQSRKTKSQKSNE